MNWFMDWKIFCKNVRCIPEMYKYLIILIQLLLLTACATEGRFDPHLKNEQNASAYLNKNTENIPLLSVAKQKQAYESFLRHYYSPWNTHSYLKIKNEIRQDSLDAINALIRH